MVSTRIPSRDGKGILFLDELNMAPPVMQGVAQQLILDRKIGSYKVPEGWRFFLPEIEKKIELPSLRCQHL